MKTEERQQARELRLQGHSYREILEQVAVSKGTLSVWLLDIFLTEDQRLRLKDARNAGREKFRVKMRANRDLRWSQFHAEAEADYQHLRFDAAFMFGLALYIGEGAKTRGNDLCVANCDPRVIQKVLQFFLRIGVPATSLRCGIHLHPELDKDAALRFWRDVTGLPPSQFHAITESLSRASSYKRGNIQRYGTCHLYGHNTRAMQKVNKWMELALAAPSFIG